MVDTSFNISTADCSSEAAFAKDLINDIQLQCEKIKIR